MFTAARLVLVPDCVAVQVRLGTKRAIQLTDVISREPRTFSPWPADLDWGWRFGPRLDGAGDLGGDSGGSAMHRVRVRPAEKTAPQSHPHTAKRRSEC